MRVFDTLPASSPRIGFFKMAASWRDAALVEFGPEGTMHYAHGAIRGETDNLYTTGMKERQIIFGDTDALESAVRDVDRSARPELLFMTSSPVSEIIGADLRRVAHDLQPQVQAWLSVWDRAPMEGTEAQGARAACERAAEYLTKTAKAQKPMERSGFLVLGLWEADWNGIADIGEIRRMARDYFGMECLNDGDGRYRLQDLGRAQWLLVASPEAEPLAKAAQSLWDTPWFAGAPYGLAGCEELVGELQRVAGRGPDRRWNVERREAMQIEGQFRDRVGKLPRRSILLDARPARCDAWQRFLERELNLEVRRPAPELSALSTDGAIAALPAPDRGDVLLGCGMLCALHPENASLCIEYPVVNQRMFSRHIPFMGVRGVENFAALLYDRLCGGA